LALTDAAFFGAAGVTGTLRTGGALRAAVAVRAGGFAGLFAVFAPPLTLFGPARRACTALTTFATLRLACFT
jgi:hypothetical protein